VIIFYTFDIQILKHKRMAKKIVSRTNNVFVADLSQFKLSEAQQSSISERIQGIVMSELAKIDTGGFVMTKPNPIKGWMIQGMIAYPVDRISNLKEQLSNFQKESPFGG
jgi:hypothetical protein